MTEPDPPNRREALRAAVAAVAKAPARPSATDEVFALLADIEQALTAGGSLEEVRLALADQGLELTPAAFRSALYRARQRRAKTGAPAPVAAPASSPAPTAQKTGPKTGNWEIPELKKYQHNPSSDDDIFK